MECNGTNLIKLGPSQDIHSNLASEMDEWCYSTVDSAYESSVFIVLSWQHCSKYGVCLRMRIYNPLVEDLDQRVFGLNYCMTSRGEEPQEMMIFSAKAPFRRRLMFFPASKHGHPGSGLQACWPICMRNIRNSISYAPLPRFLFSLSNHTICDE